VALAKPVLTKTKVVKLYFPRLKGTGLKVEDEQLKLWPSMVP